MDVSHKNFQLLYAVSRHSVKLYFLHLKGNILYVCTRICRSICITHICTTLWMLCTQMRRHEVQ